MNPGQPPVGDAAVPERLQEAADLFEARQSGANEPEGFWEDRVWLPSDRERRACCAELVPDKLKDPQKLKNHCRTLLHVASLFDLETQLLRAELRRRRAERPEPAAASSGGGPRSRRAKAAGPAARTEPASDGARSLHARLVRLIDERQAALDLLAEQASAACQELRQQLREGHAVEVALVETRVGDLAGELQVIADEITQLVITRDTLLRVLG